MAEEIKTDSKNFPEVVVAALIYNDQGEILLIQCSSKWKGCWRLPGGHVELGETCTFALKREIMEETGLEIDRIEFNDLQDCLYPKALERDAHFIFLDYRASLAGGKMAEKNREMDNYIWIKPEEALKKLEISDYTRVSLKKFIANKPTAPDVFEDKYKRAMADYQNLLKQTAKEKMEFAVFANEQMIKDILPVYGHLKMAIDHHNGESKDEWLTGVKHVAKQFKDVLEKLGVKEIEIKDEEFDHNTMEAIQSEETEDQGLDGKVAKQVKSGYRLNGRVIEAAKVVVYKVKY